MNDPPIYNIGNQAKKRALNQIFFFMWATKHCPLSFTERLVWSLLVKADRMKGQGTTQSDIAGWSRLSPKAIRKAMRKTNNSLPAASWFERIIARGEPSSHLARRRLGSPHENPKVITGQIVWVTGRLMCRVQNLTCYSTGCCWGFCGRSRATRLPHTKSATSRWPSLWGAITEG